MLSAKHEIFVLKCGNNENSKFTTKSEKMEDHKNQVKMDRIKDNQTKFTKEEDKNTRKNGQQSEKAMKRQCIDSNYVL